MGNYDYDELVKLDNQEVTLEQLEELEENELITWFENNGESGNKVGYLWYSLTIAEVENAPSKEISVYVKH